MDLHAPQIQGFFNIPVDHLLGVPVLVPYFIKKFGADKTDVVVVSPDLGSVTRARNFASRLDVPLAIVDKRRQKANASEVMNIIGTVAGKRVILVDDMIDTAGTLCNAAKALVETGGAKEVYACATHGVLSGPAIERLENSPIKSWFCSTQSPWMRTRRSQRSICFPARRYLPRLLSGFTRICRFPPCLYKLQHPVWK
jgi:ribose-phosphate pyrophosphokinase